MQPLVAATPLSPPPDASPPGIGPALSLLPEQTGPSAFTAATFEGPGLYALGMIDLLTRWTLAKRLERWCKVLLRCRCAADVRGGMSAVEPGEYARRFHRMVGGKLLGLPPEAVEADWEAGAREGRGGGTCTAAGPLSEDV